MPSYRLLNALASVLAASVRNHYAPSYETGALTVDEAITRAADDLPLDELRAAVTTLAAIALEPEEGIASRWVPRMASLSLDNEDDIETLAVIIGRKAIAGHEPVPDSFIKECGEIPSMFQSEELVDAALPADAFTSDAVYRLVFNRAVALLNERSNSGGFWWQTELEPELPFDDGPPPKTETDDQAPM